MKTTILALALAGTALLGVAGVANAAGRDRSWHEGWQQSVNGVERGQAPRVAPVTEGRNVATEATPSVQGVEPYIARQIESNRRSR